MAAVEATAAPTSHSHSAASRGIGGGTAGCNGRRGAHVAGLPDPPHGRGGSGGLLGCRAGSGGAVTHDHRRRRRVEGGPAPAPPPRQWPLGCRGRPPPSRGAPAGGPQQRRLCPAAVRRDGVAVGRPAAAANGVVPPTALQHPGWAISPPFSTLLTISPPVFSEQQCGERRNRRTAAALTRGMAAREEGHAGGREGAGGRKTGVAACRG